jgi:hypothetical protein
MVCILGTIQHYSPSAAIQEAAAMTLYKSLILKVVTMENLHSIACGSEGPLAPEHLAPKCHSTMYRFWNDKYTTSLVYRIHALVHL